MKTVALISGGKDSCYNMMCCIAEGHEIVALANLRPADKDELDSYMFQTVGHHAIGLYAEATGLPLYSRTIQGTSLSIKQDYLPQTGDEVEDLYLLLKDVMDELQIEAVSCGAILSDYQRVRVENVCLRLGLTPLAYLWRRDQDQLMREMIDCKVHAVIIKVAAMGFIPKKHLGLSLEEIYPQIKAINEKYGANLNVCGEGGEYETFVLDCPLFKKSLILEETERVEEDSLISPVGYLNLKKCRLQDKENITSSMSKRISGLPIMTSSKWKERHTLSIETSEPEHHTFSTFTETPESLSTELLEIKTYSDGREFRICNIQVKEEVCISTSTRIAMERLKVCLERLGHEMSDLTSAAIYLTDMQHYGEVNSIYKTYFTLNPPVRLVIEASLPTHVLLQMDVQGVSSQTKKTMHVQSLSHWAPANIGPYSQAVMTGGKLQTAGMIPLVPASQTLIDGPFSLQSRVALSHVEKVLDAMNPGSNLSCCPLATCFVTRAQDIPTARNTLVKSLQSSEHRHPLSVFCVVSGLPRQSPVEWQVYSWSPDILPDEQLSGSKHKLTEENFTVYAQASWTLSEPHLFSCKISIENTAIDSDALVVTREEARSMSSAIVNSYRQLVNEAPHNILTPLARLYFPSSLFDGLQLQTDWSSEEELLLVSFVPVVQLEHQQQLFVLTI